MRAVCLPLCEIAFNACSIIENIFTLKSSDFSFYYPVNGVLNQEDDVMVLEATHLRIFLLPFAGNKLT